MISRISTIRQTDHVLASQREDDLSLRIAAFRRDLCRALLSSTGRQSTLDKCLRLLLSSTFWNSGGIWGRRAGSETFVLHASRGDDARFAAFATLQLPGDSVLGRLIRSTEPMVLDEFPGGAEALESADGPLSSDPPSQEHGWTVLPLHHARHCVGILMLGATAAASPTALALLRRVAGDLAEGLVHLDRQEWLRERTRLCQSLFHSIASPIICLDREKHVSTWNPAAARTFARRGAELCGRPLSLFDEQGNRRVDELLRAALDGHTATADVIHAAHHTARQIDLSLTAAPLLDESGEAAGVVLTASDMTAQHRAERQLQLVRDASRIVSHADSLADAAPPLAQRLIESLDLSRCEIWGLDDDDAHWMNVVSRSTLGGDIEEATIPPRSMRLAASDGLPGQVRDARRPLHRTRLTNPDFFPPAMTPFGPNDPDDAIGVPVFHDDRVSAVLIVFAPRLPAADSALGTVLAAIAEQLGHRLARDRDHRDLRRGEERLRQSAKMDAIGLLAGGIAHDFNNLLTVILGHSGIALDLLKADGTHGARDLCEMIEEIENAGRRAESLTRQLLAFSHRQVFHAVALDVNQLARDMRKMLVRLIGEDIELNFSLADDLYPVKADPSQIEQILMNLVVNARDAMPHGGRITVRTRNITLRAFQTRRHPEARSGDHAVVEVADDGCGMDDETARRAFEPFFTTKSPGKGTGMGLATVYGIVRQCGGFIEVSSAAGVGTTMAVHLPRSRDALEPMQVTAPLRLSLGGRETILLAEDDDMVRGLMQRVLENRGYEVLSAGDGREAARLFDRHRDRIGLLLVDAVMPGLSGPKFVETARSRKPEMPVLYVSGYSDGTLRRCSVSGELHPLLQKPFRVDVLLRKVREILDGACPAN